MIAISVTGASAGIAGLAQAELMRGAVAGAFIVAIAFLAGYAAIRRSGLAVCALLMVAGAGALELTSLGFMSGMPSNITVMFQALFAASAIIFLSASIGAARYNPLLGGVMFTAALIIGGMGLINFFDRIDLAPMMRLALMGVGGFAVALSGYQAFRGDSGARLVLPGVLLAAAGPLLATFGAAESTVVTFAAHGMFTFGVLAASIIALTEGAPARMVEAASEHFGFQATHVHSDPHHHGFGSAAQERSEIVLDSQIARVLDYSGVGIWDWTPDCIDQTDSVPSLLGADSNAPFTPDALRNFIHPDDATRFDSELMAPVDGPFDVSLKLYDGRIMRLRGARAANEGSGEIERLVAFMEQLSPGNNGVNAARLQSATAAAVIPAATGAMEARLAAALDNGDIVAAFQPIVSLDNERIAGYEALARWRGQPAGAEEGPEKFVRAAERIGQGGVLAKTMLDQAAAFLAETLKTEKRKDLFVAMNLSWGQISDEAFLGHVRDAISTYDLPKKALVLELTEADAITDTNLAANIFRKLKDAGVALAFDDFGAGFTCLSNLRKFDFDYLKIDMSFTSDLESGGDGAKIVASLTNLGKDLGLKVIVEGVESKAASQKARQIGCAYAQGFAFGKPVEMQSAEPKREAPVVKEAAAAVPKAAPKAAPQQKPEKQEKSLAKALVEAKAEQQAAAAAEEEAAEATLASEEPSETEVDFAEEALERKHRRWRFWGGASDLR